MRHALCGWFTVAAMLACTGNARAASPARIVSARGPSVPMPAGGNGDSVAPLLSPDGRYVLFGSSANNLTPNDNSQPGLNVFLRDRATNSRAWLVLIGTAQGAPTATQDLPAVLSDDGRFVAFKTGTTNATPAAL